MSAHANNSSYAMNIPVTVIGFALVIFGRVILGQLRTSYLNRASEGISIDASKEIVLRYAIWYYIYPLLGFVLSGVVGVGILQGSPYPQAILIYKIAFVLFLAGSIFLLYQQLTARVKIFDGKLTFTQTRDRWEVAANEIGQVTLAGFTFIVRKRSEKVVRIPATFQHSEIILAFLKQAAVNK